VEVGDYFSNIVSSEVLAHGIDLDRFQMAEEISHSRIDRDPAQPEYGEISICLPPWPVAIKRWQNVKQVNDHEIRNQSRSLYADAIRPFLCT
jgi:hypothetical protein